MGSVQKSITSLKAFPLALVAIILLALILRVYGLNFGLSYMYKADEKAILRRVGAMVATADLNPHFFRYPSFYIYLQAITRLLAKGMISIREAVFRLSLSPARTHTLLTLAACLLTSIRVRPLSLSPL